MKIICTREEQDTIIEMLAENNVACVFNNNTNNVKCSDFHYQCPICIEKNIKWEITD